MFAGLPADLVATRSTLTGQNLADYVGWLGAPVVRGSPTVRQSIAPDSPPSGLSPYPPLPPPKVARRPSRNTWRSASESRASGCIRR